MFVYHARADIDQSKALWEACLEGLQAQLPSTQIDFWLRAIKPLSLVHTETLLTTELLLTCQTTQAQKINAIVSQFQAAIEKQCQQLCGHEVEWCLQAGTEHNFNTAKQASLLDTSPPENTAATINKPLIHTDNNHNNQLKITEKTAALTVNLVPQNTSKLNDETNTSSDIHAGTGLNNRLSFENFVVGKANQMAHAAAQHVAQHSGISYNPFFLYGGVGLGKTHLAHAIGNAVLASNPNARIRYIHANQFIADVVASYRRQTFDAFKRYYHTLDLLLIDDIQFFADKKRTQEEFFYAFEALLAKNSQIILTSDTYPKDLPEIENRLISRFSAGLITAIDSPEVDMRIAILHEKANALSITLQDDVAFYIANNLRSNVRELEGALHKLLAYSRFQNSHMTLEMTKLALQDVISGPRTVLSVELIQKVVADYYKVKPNDLNGKRRLASIVLPRQVAMYLTKELTHKSLPDIGNAFGGRDHTTVLHAVRKIALEKPNNPQLNHQLHVIQQALNV